MWIMHYYNGIMITYVIVTRSICAKLHQLRPPGASAPLIKVERALSNALTISCSSQRLMMPIT